MSLSTRDREKLYDAQAQKARDAGLGDLPICNIRDLPIDGTRQRWHESHDPTKPRWLGGSVTGIAHARCNTKHNNEHDTPLFAKSNRVRQKFIGAKVRKHRPMVGTVDSGIKLRIGGGRPINRSTGKEF